MFVTLRLYYYKSLSLRDRRINDVCKAKSKVKEAILGRLSSGLRIWSESPSVFEQSPLDAIADQRLFEIERNFLKVNGCQYPPIRPANTPPGYVRVEFYSDMDRLYRGKWDCWADIKLLKTGELDTSYAREAFYVDPNHFAMIDPVRWKKYPLSDDGRMSTVTLYNVTCGYNIPLRFIEIDLPRITKIKRAIRAQVLTILCMLKAVYDLLHLRAYNEFEFAVPLPWMFLVFYNLARSIHPKTRRYCVQPDLDIVPTPVDEFPIDMPWIDGDIERSKVKNLLTGPTRTQLWYASLIQLAIILWLVAAEVVACTHQTF